MIRTDRELQQTQAAIGFLEDSVAALEREVLPLNRSRFTLMAEPVIEQLASLRAEVEEYLGDGWESDPRYTSRGRREP